MSTRTLKSAAAPLALPRFKKPKWVRPPKHAHYWVLLLVEGVVLVYNIACRGWYGGTAATIGIVYAVVMLYRLRHKDNGADGDGPKGT